MPSQLLITLGVAAVALISWTVLLRVVSAGDAVDLGDMFPQPRESRWPRGVQEEEPQPWRFELLDRRPAPTTIPAGVPNVTSTPAPAGLRNGLVPQDRAA